MVKGRSFIQSGILLFFSLLFSSVQAANSFWTIESDPQTPVNVNLQVGQTAQVKYIVHNLLSTPQTLIVRHLPGVSSVDKFVLPANGTFNLTLTVKGLQSDVIGGPILCLEGGQCGQPSADQILQVRIQPRGEQVYVIAEVTPREIDLPQEKKVDVGSVTAMEPGLQVNRGSTVVLEAIPKADFGVNKWIIWDHSKGWWETQSGGLLYELNNIQKTERIMVSFGKVTLTPQTNELLLKAGGKERILRIQNTGAAEAPEIVVQPLDLPLGTHIISDACTGSILKPGATCDIKILPGSIPSSDGSQPCDTPPGSTPVASKVTVNSPKLEYYIVPVKSSLKMTPSEVNVKVLNNGCIHEGGYIFAIDDTTPETANIGGKLAGLLDEVSQEGTTVLRWEKTPENENEATRINLPASKDQKNGLTNSSLLASPAGFYPAAQACLNKTSLGYTDWYLPAICELNPDFLEPCGTENLMNSLKSKNIGGLKGRYWSSTVATSETVFSYNFEGPDEKPALWYYGPGWQFNVRCVRVFNQ